jgi:TM2 domain-containing membrane protein YozV
MSMQKIALAAMLVGGFAAVAVGLATGILAYALAAFIACFALGKGLLGIHQLLLLQAFTHGGPDPRTAFASPLLFWLYVAFKSITWVAGWGVSLYLLGRPNAFG